MNNRRKLLVVLGAGALAAPLGIFAQQKTYRVAILSGGSQVSAAVNIDAFLAGLKDLGYVEGRNISLERRFADGKLEHLPALAIELVQSKPDVILAMGSVSVQAVRKATTTIPVVMTGVGNPVGSGFVASLSRPGGNITGISNVSIVVSSKYLELLHTAAPKVTRVAVLINPAHPNHPTSLKQIQTAANGLGVKVLPLDAATPSQVEGAFAAMRRERVDGLIVPPDPFFSPHGQQIAELAIQQRLPTFFGSRTSVEKGGLMGYQPSSSDMYRRAAALVDKILKGAKPGDIPVELPTRFDLTVNLRTAKTLGLTIPQSVLLQATRVIE